MLFAKQFAHAPTERLPQCHAATIAELPDGTLCSAWYAGSYEMANDVAIYGAVLPPGGQEWVAQGVLADTPGLSEGNPILFVDRENILWLYYVTIQGRGWETCQVKSMHSTDNGQTWTEPAIVRAEWGWMTGLKPITLPDGTILLPMYEETGSCFALRARNAAGPWSVSPDLRTETGVIQPTLALLSDGRLLMLMRTYEPADGSLWQSFSHDAGQTWSSPERAALPNPNSRVDLVRLQSGRLALAFNDTPRGRTPLTLALSDDDGQSWRYRVDVETQPGEYSYPALIQAQNGILHLIYTYQRTHIAHIACDEEWLIASARS